MNSIEAVIVLISGSIGLFFIGIYILEKKKEIEFLLLVGGTGTCISIFSELAKKELISKNMVIPSLFIVPLVFFFYFIIKSLPFFKQKRLEEERTQKKLRDKHTVEVLKAIPKEIWLNNSEEKIKMIISLENMKSLNLIDKKFYKDEKARIIKSCQSEEKEDTPE